MDLAARWTHCKSELARRLAREDAEAWLDSLTLELVDRERVVLGGIPNSFFRSRILTLYRDALLEVLAAAFPERAPDALAQLELRLASAPPEDTVPATNAAFVATGSALEQLAFPGWPESAPESIASSSAPASASVSAPAASGLDPRLTLERFLVGESARPILEAVREVVRAPGQRFNPLVICGAAGLGKTHLLHGIGHALAGRTAEEGGPLRVLYGSAERFKQEVLDGMQERRMKPVRERWRAADALLLDELQFVLVAPRVQEELLHLFDAYVSSGRAVVFAADRLPRALRGLNETLRSRLEAGLVLELDPPDTETRLRYLRLRALQEGLVLAEPEAQLLAERLRGSLRQAEGVLVRLAAYGGLGGGLGGRALTREFVEHVAAPLLSDEGGWGAPVLAERIVAAVCERFGIVPKVLKAPTRTPTLVRARQVTVLLLKELAGLSYPEMGPWLGHRTPSTLSHAVHTLQQDLARHPHVLRLVQQVRADVAHAPATPPPRSASGKSRRTVSRA
jgi:chromosomal replication initiator protein